MTDKERAEKFKSVKIAVNCSTEEDAKEFVKWCYRNDIKWQFQDESITYFDSDKDGIYYIYYSAKESLCFCEKSYCIDNNYEVITFKEFMDKPITNLEYILNNFDRETILNTHSICMYLRTCLGMQDCVDGNIQSIKIHCCECKFNDQYEVLKCLNEIYKEPITKLTKVQYEILKCLPQNSSIIISNNELIVHKDNLEMFMNKLGVKIIDSDNHEEKSFKIKDILENCEVVE